MVRPGEDRRPPATCHPTVHLAQSNLDKAPTPNSGPQGQAPASRPRGQTALCARRAGVPKDDSACPTLYRERHQRATPSSAAVVPARKRQRPRVLCIRGSHAVGPIATNAARLAPKQEQVRRPRASPAARVVEGEVDVGEAQRGPAPSARRAASRRRRSSKWHPNRGHRPWKGRGAGIPE